MLISRFVVPGNRVGYCLLFCCFLCLGCSDKKYATYPVSGVVKFEDGTVVEAGRVEFYNYDQEVSARGTISSDGSFTMGTETTNDGAVAGEHQVLIMQVVTRSQAGVTAHEHGAHIDESYASFRSSGLTFTVDPKQDNFAEFVVRKRNSARH